MFNYSANFESATLSLSAIIGISFTVKLVLFILSFICFIFCISWLLVHKGSKFWQENWEKHIDYLESLYMGNVYKSLLDTKNDNKFNRSPFSEKPYKYSVTKISYFCSLLFSCCSFLLVFFHMGILLLSCEGINEFILFPSNEAFWSIITISAVILFSLFYFTNITLKANDNKYEKETDYFISNGKTIKIKKIFH